MEKSAIIHLLHSIPHINVSLHMVNSTFNPSSEVYIEVKKSGNEFSTYRVELAYRQVFEQLNGSDFK